MKYFLSLILILSVSCSSKPTVTETPKEINAVAETSQPDPEIDNKDLVLLSREVAKSSDKHFGKKTRGICGKTAEEMQQILRAIQAKMDQQQMTSTEVDRILAENKKCGKNCAKVLCSSSTFQKLDSEKSNYGSTSDGV